MGIRGLVAVGNLPLPKWLLIVKCVIIFLSVIILALSAYALSLSGTYYRYTGGAPGFLIFLTIMTWIIYGTSIFIELKTPQYNYRIVFLIAYSISVIFWLAGWAWAASWASASLAYAFYNVDVAFGGAMAGNAAIGAIIWVLSVIYLVFFIIAALRESASPDNVELGHAQKQNQPHGQPVYEQQPYNAQTQPVGP